MEHLSRETLADIKEKILKKGWTIERLARQHGLSVEELKSELKTLYKTKTGSGRHFYAKLLAKAQDNEKSVSNYVIESKFLTEYWREVEQTPGNFFIHEVSKVALERVEASGIDITGVKDLLRRKIIWIDKRQGNLKQYEDFPNWMIKIVRLAKILKGQVYLITDNPTLKELAEKEGVEVI